MTRLLATAPLLFAFVVFWVGDVALQSFSTRLESAERIARQESLRARDALRAVESLREEVTTLEGRVSEAADRFERVRPLEARLESTEELLGEMTRLAEARGEEIDRLRAAHSRLEAASLDERIAALDRALEESGARALAAAADADRIARETRRELSRLGEELVGPTDPIQLWNGLLGPVVKLSGESSVGSGVLLPSHPVEGAEGRFETFLLTAWHVVRDIEDEKKAPDGRIPVFVYEPDGAAREHVAELIARDSDMDAALLRLETEAAFAHGARLPDRTRLETVRIFRPVWAVGCPLGNDPIPTAGEIASLSHEVDGERYWMINAQTFIGNSGGGIFDARTHELLGLFSKIYNYGSLRPTIVPHMGLVTPLADVYDWLTEAGYGDLVPRTPADASRVAHAAAAPTAATPAAADVTD